MGLLRKVGPK